MEWWVLPGAAGQRLACPAVHYVRLMTTPPSPVCARFALALRTAPQDLRMREREKVRRRECGWVNGGFFRGNVWQTTGKPRSQADRLTKKSQRLGAMEGLHDLGALNELGICTRTLQSDKTKMSETKINKNRIESYVKFLRINSTPNSFNIISPCSTVSWQSAFKIEKKVKEIFKVDKLQFPIHNLNK